MVDERDLVEGACYFAVFYHDKGLRIPKISTLIFVGKASGTTSSSAKPLWCFMDPETYDRFGPISNESENGEYVLHRFDEDTLFSIYDWHGLIEELAENKRAQDEGRIYDGTAHQSQ